jgi:hypothetical protein
MKKPKTILLALAIAAIAFTAWADNSAAVNKPKSDKDNSATVAPAQAATQPDKPDQATQPGDGNVQAPKSNPDAAQPPQSRPDAVRQPNPSESGQPRAVTEPAPRVVQPDQNGQNNRGPSNPGDINVPQTGGNPRNQGGGSTYGGYGGGNGGGRGYGGYGGGHNYSGLNWHGRHEEWRYQNYHGSWSFLFDFGPVIYYAPIHYPYIVRLEHDRVGVYVRYTGEDHVGTQFADAVRQHLSDAGMRVVYSQDDAQLELYIISMEEDPGDAGYGSSISISYVWYPGHKFITAQMVDAGLNEVDDLAQSVASYTSDLIDQYR